MKNWPVRTIGDTCDILDSRRIPITKKDRAPGPYPYYGATGILSYVENYIFDERLVLVGEDGAKWGASDNSAFIAEGKYWVNNHAHVIRPNKNEVLDNWLVYFLNFSDLAPFIKGLTVPKLNQENLRSIPFPVPPIEEQRRVVAVLDQAFACIDKAKANTEKNIQNARDLFDSYLNNTFSNPGPDWQEKQLNELCEIKHGFAFKSEFFTDTGDYVLLTPGNFYESGGYRDRGEKQKYYNGEIPKDFVLSEGDLLVAMTEQAAGLLGSPIIVPKSKKFLHNQRLGLVKAKPGVPWSNDFFFHAFNLPFIRKELHATGTGVKVRHTSPTKIGNVAVSFPPSVSVQKQIVATLKDLQDEIKRLGSTYERKIVELNELKKSFLQKAFSGEISENI